MMVGNPELCEQNIDEIQKELDGLDKNQVQEVDFFHTRENYMNGSANVVNGSVNYLKPEKSEPKMADSIEASGLYESCLSNLRNKFPEIPNDLKNRTVEIMYRKDGKINKLELRDFWMSISDKYELHVLSGPDWHGKSFQESPPYKVIDFSSESFNSKVSDFITNSEKCGIVVDGDVVKNEDEVKRIINTEALIRGKGF